MSTKGTLGTKGLQTAPNPLTAPPGSLGLARNCVIPSKDLLEPRRGQQLYNHAFGATTDTALALCEWEDQVLVHYGTTASGTSLDILLTDDADVDGNALTALGGIVAPDPARLRVKFAALSSNLYITNSTGLRVVRSTSTSVLAAGLSRPYGLPYNGTIQYPVVTGNPDASGSWMTTDASVAYRAVVGRKDENGNVKLSPPSERVITINSADVAVGVGGLSRTTNVVTATVAAHNFDVGTVINVTTADGNFNTTNVTLTAATSTTVTYTHNGADGVSANTATLTNGTKSVTAIVQLARSGSGGAWGARAGDFVQLYRTENATAAVDPGDECFLAYERTISSADLTAGYVTITDTTPESYLGEALYTNANTGEGILQANEQPPNMNDVCVFDGRLFGAQTTDRQALSLRLIGVGSPNGLQTNDLFAVGTTVYTVTAFSTFLPSRNIAITAQGMKVQVTSATFAHTPRKAYVVVDDNETTVTLQVVDIALNGGTFYAATDRASAFSNALPTITAVTEASTSRTGSTVTVTTATAHGLAAGDSFVLAYASTTTADANFPAGTKEVVTAASTSTLTYTEAGSASTMVGTAYVYAATYGSDTGARQLRYTKQGQPEAWPVSNWIGGLPDGQTLLRIADLRGTLYCFFEHGDIYTVAGTYPYSVSKFDGTAVLLAADSLVEHAGRLHCLTTQGVVAISETGVEVLSYPIERDLRTRIASLTDTQLSRTFGVSYESDRQYQLWMADASAPTSLTCTGAWVYHSDSGLWTQWGGTTSGTRANRTCGLVAKATDRLMLGDGDTGSLVKPQNKLRREAKAYTQADITEYSYSFTATGVDSTGVLTPAATSSITYIQAGDVLLYSGNYAIVTANNTSTLTYSGTLGDPSAASVTAYMQVPTSVEWLIDAGGAAGVEKHWQEFQLHYDYCITPTLTALFLNERSVGATSPVTITPPDYVTADDPLTATGVMRTMRAGIPATMQRAAMQRLRVTTAGLAYWRLLGWSQTSQPTSEKTPI